MASSIQVYEGVIHDAEQFLNQDSFDQAIALISDLAIDNDQILSMFDSDAPHHLFLLGHAAARKLPINDNALPTYDKIKALISVDTFFATNDSLPQSIIQLADGFINGLLERIATQSVPILHLDIQAAKKISGSGL